MNTFRRTFDSECSREAMNINSFSSSGIVTAPGSTWQEMNTRNEIRPRLSPGTKEPPTSGNTLHATDTVDCLAEALPRGPAPPRDVLIKQRDSQGGSEGDDARHGVGKLLRSAIKLSDSLCTSAASYPYSYKTQVATFISEKYQNLRLK